MKYVILLCDGMADRPVSALGDRTPMRAAKKPHMDRLAGSSFAGMVKTVDDALSPGSDVANLSVLGYDPRSCYTGRSPLEAVSIGIDLGEDDVALRCNFVTLSRDASYTDKTMEDYCAGDISTAEADELIKALNARFGGKDFRFYTGFSYRHCLIWRGGATELGELTPPHDIIGHAIGAHLSAAPAAAPLIGMMRESCKLLEGHPVNKVRVSQGKPPANAIWLWGEGRRPRLQSFKEKFGKSGAIVSAVDLLKGIGKCVGMKVPVVKGATGYIDTNFEGKAFAALEMLEEVDLVYLHVEAPDECGHRGETDNKVKSIEYIDRRVLGHLLEKIKHYPAYKIMILPDHPTPLSLRTHTSDPVPFIIYEKNRPRPGVSCFCEETALQTGIYIAEGHRLMQMFLE